MNFSETGAKTDPSPALVVYFFICKKCDMIGCIHFYFTFLEFYATSFSTFSFKTKEIINVILRFTEFGNYNFSYLNYNFTKGYALYHEFRKKDSEVS